MELLAHFRPDPALTAELDAIIENDDQAEQSAPAGTLDINAWLAPRQASIAQLDGVFCDVTDAETIAALFPRFKPRASTYGLPDFDAAALKTAEPRRLTQEVSQYLWEAKSPNGENLCDGIKFSSRHGENFTLWAVYERPGDPEVTPRIAEIQAAQFSSVTPELNEAAKLLGIILR